MNRSSLAAVFALLLLVPASACNWMARPVASDARKAAAAQFTKRYSLSRFAQWGVHARPAGTDCGVLLIESGVLMDRAMVETVQFGAGSSDIYEAGAQRFAREKGFRGTAYRDPGDAYWGYDISDQEAQTVQPCR